MLTLSVHGGGDYFSIMNMTPKLRTQLMEKLIEKAEQANPDGPQRQKLLEPGKMSKPQKAPEARAQSR